MTKPSVDSSPSRPRPIDTKPWPIAAAAAAASSCPLLSLGLWHNFGDDAVPTAAALSSAPLTSASPISTWPTTTARPRLGRGELRPRPARRTSRPSAMSSSSPQRPAMTCGPAPTGNGAPANTCSPASTRASAASDWTPSTSSTAIAPIPRLRWRRRCGALATRSGGQGALRGDLLVLRRRRPGGRRRSCARSARPCLIHQPRYSMFNRWIEDGLFDVLVGEGSAASSSPRWHRAC